MAGFRKSTATPTVPNKEGFPAYEMGAKTALVKAVMTSYNEPKFYDPKNNRPNEIVGYARKVMETDPEFVLKTAAYARNEGNLRSAPIALLVEFANTPHAEVKGSRKWVPIIARRGDEIPEALACQFKRNDAIARKGKIPNMLKYGLKESFENLTPYQLAKYRGEGKDVTLRDAMFLLHPAPQSIELEKAYKRLAEGSLTIAEGATWERIISKEGSNPETWTRAAYVMPYMALLRNLRNFVINDITPEAMKMVCAKIANPSHVAASKQMPYRFLSAYKELEKINAPAYVLAAVSDALDASVGNLPEMEGRTAIWCDNSGSMRSPISFKSVVECVDVATIMAAALYRANPDSIVGVFGNTAQRVSLNPRDSVMTNARKLAATNVGYSTEGHLAIDKTAPDRVDRIVFFSDMQTYGGYVDEAFSEYCREYNKNCRFISFDLQGYGTSPFPKNDSRVMEFTGWSDKALKLISKSPEGIVAEIEATSLASYR